MTKSVFLAVATWSVQAVLGSEGGVSFSYDPTSDHGPAHWKDLHYEDGTDNQCGGSNNSPIAIEKARCELYEDYVLTTGTCTLGEFGFVINHHAEQVNAPEFEECVSNTMQIPGVEGVFEMLQFHIHMSSEHSFDNNFFGAELHVVHKEKGGDRFAVLGMFLLPTATESNPIFNELLTEFDAIADETYQKCNKTLLPHWWQANGENELDFSKQQLNVYELIPDGATVYNYAGGLTTPPCTEIVEWNVVDMPIEITVAQFNDLSSLILNYMEEETCELATVADPNSGSTSRPPQDLNGRHVRRICPAGFVDPEAVEELEATESGASFQNTFFAVSVVLSTILAVLGF